MRKTTLVATCTLLGVGAGAVWWNGGGDGVTEEATITLPRLTTAQAAGRTLLDADFCTKLGREELFEDSPDIVSAMPGFGDTLSDDEIWSVLAFIKASWSGEMQASQTMASQHDPLPDEYRPGKPG